MADGYSHLPGDLDVLQSDRNISQTTILLPSPSPLKRVSTYYPKRGPQVLEDSNTDPFYLEQSLKDTGHWDSFNSGARDVRFNEEANQYFMLSTVNPANEYPVPVCPRGPTLRSRFNPNRSTLSVVELENNLSFQEFAAQHWERQPLHYSQGSIGSEHSTPDLTPSSSFSSSYSAPLRSDAVLKATEQLSIQAQQASCEPESQIFLTPCHPPPWSRPVVSTQPSTPTRNSKCKLRFQNDLNDSTDTLTMHSVDNPQPMWSRRGKPLPTLPNLARAGISNTGRKGSKQGNRSPIEPSMISPPSSIDPVTMEPHPSHFDQPLFIDYPSPVPSPVAPSPPIERQSTIQSAKERPSTSTSEVFCCEQSVWESDSESESVGRKSLSRKPIDTLRKVRSRVQLRVAKSAPKLNAAIAAAHDDSELEKFPSMSDHLPERPSTMDHFPTGRELRHTAHQTLRLVAPSTTSLVRPRSRSRQDSQPGEYDIDRSTAAALQARSRRRQRSTSPDNAILPDPEKVCTLCREERSHNTIHNSLTLTRPPFFKRVWESLRILGCHNEMAHPKPTRSSF